LEEELVIEGEDKKSLTPKIKENINSDLYKKEFAHCIKLVSMKEEKITIDEENFTIFTPDIDFSENEEAQYNKDSQKNVEIYIDFKSILNITDDNPILLSELNFCKIKKRTIRNRIYEFFKDVQLVLSYCDKDIFLSLLKLKILLTTAKKKKSEIEAMTKEVIAKMTPLINFIVDEVIIEEAYTPQRTEEEVLKEPSLQELFFGEIHLKYLIKLTILNKILLLFFEEIHPDYDAKDIKKSVMQISWNTNFIKDEKVINMMNKIQKLIHSRITGTVYVDSRFWEHAKMFNLTPASYGNSLFSKFLSEIVLILKIGNNPIPFIDVVIRSNVQWLFKKDFQLEFITSDVDKRTETLDREILNTIDNSENKKILRNILVNENIKTFIKNEASKYMDITKEEFDLIEEKFEKNIVHLFVMFPFISKKLNINIQTLLKIERSVFIYLLIYTSRILLSKNYILLSKLLLSNIKFKKEKDMEKIKNYKIIKDITDSREFQQIIEDNYTNFKDLVQKENIILQPLILFYYNEFVDFKGEKIQILLPELSQEYLMFLKELNNEFK